VTQLRDTINCVALNSPDTELIANSINTLEDTENSREATPCNQSRITIWTSMINEWIQTAIADNGFGIPTAIQQRIFKPFLTTKPIGKGTGIDMSISYQIDTEQHGGKIQCVSIPGAETEFVIPILCRQRYAAV
jgi:signal transduction histidine kinase